MQCMLLQDDKVEEDERGGQLVGHIFEYKFKSCYIVSVQLN